jgi:hypothetical protein
MFDHLREPVSKAPETVKPNREDMPKEALQQDLKRGKHIFCRINSL